MAFGKLHRIHARVLFTVSFFAGIAVFCAFFFCPGLSDFFDSDLWKTRSNALHQVWYLSQWPLLPWRRSTFNAAHLRFNYFVYAFLIQILQPPRIEDSRTGDDVKAMTAALKASDQSLSEWIRSTMHCMLQ
jgi:hypothetical protein